uniref:Homeobox domain-containing protein n=1 Tax=Sciurus vulgaris TaxID=55149 RepID=A0A8D2CQD9_SCIVU
YGRSYMHYCDPNYYGLGMYNMEIAAEAGEGVPVAAAEAAAAAALGGHGREGAEGLMEDVMQEGYLNHEGAVNQGGLYTTRRPEQPANMVTMVPQPWHSCPRIQYKFSKWHLQELESVFQITQYPDVTTRRGLARRPNVTETRVQVWFNNRRTKYRKHQRKLMLGDGPSVILCYCNYWVVCYSNPVTIWMGAIFSV